MNSVGAILFAAVILIMNAFSGAMILSIEDINGGKCQGRIDLSCTYDKRWYFEPATSPCFNGKVLVSFPGAGVFCYFKWRRSGDSTSYGRRCGGSDRWFEIGRYQNWTQQCIRLQRRNFRVFRCRNKSVKDFKLKAWGGTTEGAGEVLKLSAKSDAGIAC